MTELTKGTKVVFAGGLHRGIIKTPPSDDTNREAIVTLDDGTDIPAHESVLAADLE